MALLGLALTPLCRGLLALLLCFGILMPAGLGAFSFGLIMGAVTPLLGEKRAAAVSGVINASSGLGSILLALVLRGTLDGFGLWGAIIALCLPLVCLTPVLLLLRKADARQSESRPPLLRPLLKSAFRDRSYLLLSLAFFTCGFHMAIIEAHLYTQFTSYGFTEQSVTYAFSIYGIATMAGSVVSGWLGSRFPMKNVLGGFYASRTLRIVGFLLLPRSLATMYAFAILLGFTGMATVPPTSGLIGRRFGPAALGTLFGVAFLFHQLGSFVSAWIGGLTVAATGGYTLIWCIDAALCLPGQDPRRAAADMTSAYQESPRGRGGFLFVPIVPTRRKEIFYKRFFCRLSSAVDHCDPGVLRLKVTARICHVPLSSAAGLHVRSCTACAVCVDLFICLWYHQCTGTGAVLAGKCVAASDPLAILSPESFWAAWGKPCRSRNPAENTLAHMTSR